MKTSSTLSLIAALIVIIAIIGGLYYYEHRPLLPASAPMIPYTTANSTTTQGDGTPVGENLILGLSTSQALGTYLSAYNGMTLYTYSPDMAVMGNADASTCTGACAANWPPYTVPAVSDIHVSAATTGTVGTTMRADGTLQVTYNGMPLYFYSKDTTPGQTEGQGVGGVWYVAKP